MKIKLEVAYTNEETISQLDSALEEIEDIKVEKFEQNGFDGFDLLYYFLETGTAVVLIEKLCKIIIAFIKRNDCNGVQREHNKKLNNGLPILHKVPPKRDFGRDFCIMAEKGETSHGGLTEKLSPFFHAKKQEVNAYGR